MRAQCRLGPLATYLLPAAVTLVTACSGVDLPDTRSGTLVLSRVMTPEPIIPGGKPENASMAVYLTITNEGDSPDTLLAATSAMARTGMLHGSMPGSGMSMMSALVIPAHDSVRMVPGGLHLMFEGLTRVIEHGDRFPFELQFARGGRVAAQSTVVTYPQFDKLRGDAPSR
jgi:copper(I)-binding protein